ncbi:MAG: MAPEG family protein, partial [Myxococcota bacterium]|nr:MAPEG family protein [Myxococcota bacterium]
LGWPVIAVGAEPGARLAFALPWCFVAFVPYALVCVTISQLRLFQGAHDPLAGAEDEALKLHCRVMQNTLEQLVWFVLCILPLSVLLGPDQVHLVPLSAGVFTLARLAYWRGYFLKGTLGRRYGVQMTFTLNGCLMVLVPLLWLGVI